MKDKVLITRIEFHNFKAFKYYSVSLDRMNILVGPNNTGKSTILNAFRVLAAGLRRANSYKAVPVDTPIGRVYGHFVSTDDLPISLENVHTNYDEDLPVSVVFHLSNKQKLTLYFSTSGTCVMVPSNTSRMNGTPSVFRKVFSINVGFVPVLGPLEHEEPLIQERTVLRNLVTHRASRNFRNYWHYSPDRFGDFAELISKTWSGMEVAPPELVNHNYLAMFCKEDRIDRELYWAGFGFQIWCQLLTHIVRNDKVDLLVVDEPDIYLHPDMQRQILGILRDTNPDILLATHSTEIIAEASPSEILLIDKTRRSAIRLKDTDQVQGALDILGSGQNITLTQLARTRRVLFVEGKDFRILSRFARQLGLTDIANQSDFTVVSSDGFSQWNKIKSLAWGFEKTLGQSLVLGAVFDRDYRSDEEIAEIKNELDENLNFAHIHSRKELENYLLVPSVLDRAISRKLQEQKRKGKTESDEVPNAKTILSTITDPMHPDVLGQYTSWRTQFYRKRRSSITEATINRETIKTFEKKWADIDIRMEVVPGKDTFRELNKYLRDNFQFNLTDTYVISNFTRDEVPPDLFMLLRRLEKFKKMEAS